MLARLGAAADRLVRRILPDPFVLVLLLTLATFAAGVAMLLAHGVPMPHGAPRPTDFLGALWWTRAFLYKGFAELLTFAMQMVLIVVSGEAIAASPPVSRAIRRAASVPKTPRGCVLIVSATALALGWFHWGFGLMSAAMFAREVAANARTRGIRVHYALLGTAAYMSMLLWHAGLSASAPLLINTPNHFLAPVIGIVPLSQTVFLARNLVVCAVLAALVPFVLRALHPAPDASVEIEPDFVRTFRHEPNGPGIEAAAGPRTFAAWLDSVRAWQLAVSALGVWFLVQYFRAGSLFDLNQNVLNFGFVMIGMALYPTPVAYAQAIARSVKGTSGIVLQFPFYGAVMAIIRDTGLNHLVADAFVRVADARTLPFFAYLASLCTKLFVPSGGGEWAVEGPVMLEAAKHLRGDVGLTTMGVAYGNMAGNMFQPFWALPLLGILGLRARDIMGYALVVFVVAAPILGVALLAP